MGVQAADIGAVDIGRSQSDLLRDPAQQMRYGYASGNPLAWTDPLGLCNTSLWSKFKGAVTDLGHQAVGTAEAAGTVVSGAAASLGGGLTYLGTAALTGGDWEAATAVSEGVQSSLTYQPISPYGQGYVNTLGNATAVVGEAYKEHVADNLANAYGPGVGTAVLVLPELLPGKRATGGLSVPKQGGRYSELVTNGAHRHHMPSKKASPLSESDGPAIRMSPEDHRKTASYGGRVGSPQDAYRTKQADLIDQGRFDDAFLMDVDDIHSKFGSKYDEAILEAMDVLP